MGFPFRPFRSCRSGHRMRPVCGRADRPRSPQPSAGTRQRSSSFHRVRLDGVVVFDGVALELEVPSRRAPRGTVATRVRLRFPCGVQAPFDVIGPRLPRAPEVGRKVHALAALVMDEPHAIVRHQALLENAPMTEATTKAPMATQMPNPRRPRLNASVTQPAVPRRT